MTIFAHTEKHRMTSLQVIPWKLEQTTAPPEEIQVEETKLKNGIT